MAELASTVAATEADRLAQAEALVRAYCGWHIAPSRSGTLTVSRSRDTVLVLPTLFVTSVVSVTIDGVALDADSYAWSTAGVVTRLDQWCDPAWWRYGGPEVVIDFIHGYDAAPPDVTAVVQAVAARATGNPDSLVREQVGPFTNTYSQTGTNQASPLALLASEKEALNVYRLPQRA